MKSCNKSEKIVTSREEKEEKKIINKFENSSKNNWGYNSNTENFT
jgi:hypothetical protein